MYYNVDDVEQQQPQQQQQSKNVTMQKYGA